jgi:drug/metabolite transporter (DMT)-like permease
MILALGPIQVALFQWWRTHRRPDNFTLGAIALALVGELLVITSGDLARLTGGDALGNGLVFLASLFWTAYTLGGQQFPGWSPVRYTALSCSLGCFAIAAARGRRHPGRPQPAAAARTDDRRLAAARLHRLLRLGVRHPVLEHGRGQARPAPPACSPTSRPSSPT